MTNFVEIHYDQYASSFHLKYRNGNISKQYMNTLIEVLDAIKDHQSVEWFVDMWDKVTRLNRFGWIKQVVDVDQYSRSQMDDFSNYPYYNFQPIRHEVSNLKRKKACMNCIDWKVTYIKSISSIEISPYNDQSIIN